MCLYVCVCVCVFVCLCSWLGSVWGMRFTTRDYILMGGGGGVVLVLLVVLGVVVVRQRRRAAKFSQLLSNTSRGEPSFYHAINGPISESGWTPAYAASSPIPPPTLDVRPVSVTHDPFSSASRVSIDPFGRSHTTHGGGRRPAPDRGRSVLVTPDVIYERTTSHHV